MSALATDDDEKSLHQFISETDCWVNSIFDSLCWTSSSLFEAEDLVRCPVNHDHFVSQKSSREHGDLCNLVSRGYSLEELKTDQSSKFFYEKAPLVSSLDLDESTLMSLLANAGDGTPSKLPATMSQWMISLTAAQRLKIYDHCIEMAREARNSTQYHDEDLMLVESFKAQSSDKPQSKLEELAKQRDLKRRRQSYRGKNTHTSKKSHTEVIRDMLCNQMEILASIWADEAKCKEEKEDSDDDEERETIPRSPHQTNQTTVQEHSERDRSRRDRDRNKQANESHHHHHHSADIRSKSKSSRREGVNDIDNNDDDTDDDRHVRHDRRRSRDRNNDAERRLRVRSRSRERERRSRAEEEEKLKRAEISSIRESRRIRSGGGSGGIHRTESGGSGTSGSRKVRIVGGNIKEDPEGTERTVRSGVVVEIKREEPSGD